VTAVGDFSGSEPLVGEIRALRTFRVDDEGTLLPLYSNGAWYDGVNTATCSPPTGDHHRRGSHQVPASDCECGFYGYGTVEAAEQNRHARYVRAVVSCWGGVIAGTQGVRAEHARIDAIWLHPEAPRWLRLRVGVRYPSARIYAAADAMVAEHPLTALSCYETREKVQPAARVGAVAGVLALIGLGLLPLGSLHGSVPLWDAWLAVTAAVAVLTAWLTVGTHAVGHLAAAFVMAGVLGWLLAPLFGVTGWLLRVPLLRGMAVAVGGYLLTLRPHYFPIVATPRERAFCGVRA
jgi:hypothetical protein